MSNNLTFDVALRLARGCRDYKGGHDGDCYEAFQMGVETVVNALTKAQKHGLSEPQTRALHAMGAEELKS